MACEAPRHPPGISMMLTVLNQTRYPYVLWLACTAIKAMTVTVDPTSGLGQVELLRRLETVASRAARQTFGDGCMLERINQSENTTYLVKLAEGDHKILRIHRTGYHSPAAIRSEHQWMAALRDEAGVRTPKLLRAGDGTDILRIVTDDLPEGRHCVFFEYLDGVAPDSADLLGNFPNLGEVTARMHQHVIGWRLPKGFERFTWDLDSIFGERPHWGHWHDSPWLDRASEPVLSRLVDTLKARLLRFGCGPERFGLIHADMRLANLLVHDGETRVIDFDDSGFSWFLYDLATALSFIEGRADVMELVDAWLTGYQRVRSLSKEEVAEIPTFLMLRRMLILAWIGSHSETELAQALGPEFTRASVDLAEEFVSRTVN